MFALAAAQTHRPVWALIVFVVFVFSFLPLAVFAARHRSES
jgi:hypothetical protein